MKHLTLRQAREARGWTQEQLAERSGVAQARISYIETATTKDPQNSTVKALEHALGVRRGTLVFGQEALSA